MDAKDLRTDSTLSDRKDGSKYSQSVVAQLCNRNKTYQDVGTNPLGKAETAAAVRPCAVIGPDRVLPAASANDPYLKKGSIEPWPCPDNIYSQLPDYHHKVTSNPNQMRNISPRQTYQENMQRIMVPPTYNSIKNTTDGSTFNLAQDRPAVLSKNPKPNMATDAKYCDVPYTVNQLSNEHKSFRESEISVPSVNSPLMRTIPHGWSPNSGNIHAPRTYSGHEVYQYQQYPNCVGPRPPMLPVGRRPQTFQDEAGYVYPDSYYQDPSLRFRTYPQVKERYPQPRFDYIGNYPNPYHPPPTFPPHKYDIPKPGSAHQYPVYTHLKYLESRGSDPNIDAYQRPSNQPPPGYNMPFRNQVIHPTYPGVGNAQTKVLPYSIDSSGKPIGSNKPYDSNKVYIDYDNARNKSYAVNDPYFINEINRIQPSKNQVMPPNYPTAPMHHIPTQQFLRKDIHMKSHEFMPHFRNFDPSVGSYTMIRHPSQFSPNTIAISPTDSNTSNDTTQTQGTNQEDCGYVSQSSSASIRSLESGVNRMPSEYYKRHEYRYGPIGNTHIRAKHEVRGKKQIDVRQFLSMWNEGDDDNAENNNKESNGQTSTSNVKKDDKQEQLYVLGLVNVPSEELSKYDHIQTVSKLPEHIKGYNSIELLKQYEEVVESSNMGSFKSPVSKNYSMPLRDNRNTPKQVVEVSPRPISPLDVEAKISQSVIHKEVGCNFEIKPCSPKMLNVEIPAPVQNVLGERIIQKVSNPQSKVTESSLTVRADDASLRINLKRQTSLPSYENSSCKILSSTFAAHNVDSDKTDYSIQDLEINSGVCLASLPRLDNEIELNFPEVNQQFIDANKIDNTSNEQSKRKESDNAVELNSLKENVDDNKEIEGQNLKFSQHDSQKEYTRLNSYRKSNPIEHSENIMTAVRTDSVIIKNPETLKNVGNSPCNDNKKNITEETHVPVNLTSHTNVNIQTKNPGSDSQCHQDKTETYAAIDFSLNKNDLNRTHKASKRTKGRTSKQNINEKNKPTTNNFLGVPLTNTNTHNKDNQIHKSNIETGIQLTTTYKKESNSSSYLPNLTYEEIDNFNQYSCKADFDDVMKKLTSNDFDMTSAINLESYNITNENDGLNKESSLNFNEQHFKPKIDTHPTNNEQFATSLQQLNNLNSDDTEILEAKGKSNQQSNENKKLNKNDSKIEEQTELQPQTDNKEIKCVNDKLKGEGGITSVHQQTEFETLDINYLTDEKHSIKTKKDVDIENEVVNSLSEKENPILTGFENPNIDTPIEESQSAMAIQKITNDEYDITAVLRQETERENLKIDNLSEAVQSIKTELPVEIENGSVNNLSEKDNITTTRFNNPKIDTSIEESQRPIAIKKEANDKCDITAALYEKTECDNIKLDKLAEAERSMNTKQLLKIKNIAVNNLSEEDKKIPVEFENSNFVTSAGEKVLGQKIVNEECAITAVLHQQTESEKLDIDKLSEKKPSIYEKPFEIEIKNVDVNTSTGDGEKESVKKHLVGIQNNGTNSLNEINETFNLDMPIEKEQCTLEQAENYLANTVSEEQQPKKIQNSGSNILTKDDQSIPLELQVQEIKILDPNTLSDTTHEQENITLVTKILNKRDQNAQTKQQIVDIATDPVNEENNKSNENSSQKNISLNTRVLTEEDQTGKLQPHLAIAPTLENIEMNVIIIGDYGLIQKNSSLPLNETFGTDLVFEEAQCTVQKQNLKETGTIAENTRLIKNELFSENLYLDKTKMTVELKSAEITIHHDTIMNKKVTVDAIADEEPYSSQNDRSQLSIKNNNLYTEMLIEPRSVEIQKDEKSKTITENQSITLNEMPQLPTENTNYDAEMLVDLQSVEKKIQSDDICKITHAVSKIDQSMSQTLQSEDADMPMNEVNLNLSHESSLCLEEDSLNEHSSVYLIENIPLPPNVSIDSNDSNELLQNDDLSNNNKRNEEIEHYIDCNFVKHIYKNNDILYKIKLYSPQIQNLILHVEGFINCSNSKQSETSLYTKVGENETTNEIVDKELRTNELPCNSELFDVKTGTKEALETQNNDSELLSPITTKPVIIISEPAKEINTLNIVNTLNPQDKSQLKFDEKRNSPKSVTVKSDLNSSYSTIEEVSPLIITKNLDTSNKNEQNMMVNDYTVTTKCKEIKDNESSLLDRGSTPATTDRVSVFPQKTDKIDNDITDNPDCGNTDLDEINTRGLRYSADIENERVDIDNNLHHNNTDVTSEQNDMTLLATYDQSLATPESDEVDVVYSLDNNLPEVRKSDQSNNFAKIKHNRLKRSLSDSALNTYVLDNNRELGWPTKRRKIDENSLEQNMINESICRLIQASRRNSVSTFENDENVSFCILIDDTCILSEGNAEDKICYAEITESTENDTMHQSEDNVVMGSPLSQSDIDLMTTDTVIYQCKDDAEDEGTWVEDIACIETVSCENVIEELVMCSPSPKHDFNDTVISDNVAEDVVISSPSSIKYFEDDFVNGAPTFSHDWVETLVDNGVAQDVVISSFLTTKKDCLEEEIRTNLEETISNSSSNLTGDWNEKVNENIGVSSVLSLRKDWNETLADVNNEDDVVAYPRSSANYDCLEPSIKEINEENVLVTSPSQNYVTKSEFKSNVTGSNMDSSLKPQRSHSFERVVKVTDVMITDSPSSSKDHLEYNDTELSCYDLHEHANKVKSIYGERMTDGDAQIVDTLFRTPQMDVNKTLLHDPLEFDISAKLSHMEYSDDSSSESSHQKNSTCIFSGYSDCKYNNSDIANCNTYQKENIAAVKSKSTSNDCNESSETDNYLSAKCPQDKTIHSCESSADNVFTYEDSNYTSSSPEVSSTTSEERNSGILLKITNLNGSRISQINETKSDPKPRCKFTEKKDYSSNRFPNRPLITKAAQKYIPPVKESIRDLKVKITLPPQRLLKFKELKISRNVTKVTNKSSTNIPKITKKPKPLFEDVLKSIDEIQIKMHREKKKPKTTTIPKVVIKKNEYGSHYASTPTKEVFNPDLTGRKWQPWVFIERNNFIDKMALKNNTKAVFNHRKKCFVLAEKFKKYKSAVSNTKFIISRPSSIKSSGQLKYTIRFKHNY